LFNDQFAYRPTGSTEAALISILSHITDSLTSHTYVRVIALDFSKAFDTLRHSSILSKLAQLPIDDCIYNWFVQFFTDHSHATRFRGVTSDLAAINSSVYQGSVIGPSMFNINGIDLKPTIPGNTIDKYADDSYLVVPSGNDSTTQAELDSIALWAGSNNLHLNLNKCTEMIVYSSNQKG